MIHTEEPDSRQIPQTTGADPAARLDEAGLLAAELWLEERIHADAAPRLRHPRIRMWFIFMLLRYAGLRLVEIFRLGRDCLDFGRASLHVPGTGRKAGRELPLPPAVAGRLGKMWAAWPCRESPLPFQCEASRVRRALRQCALACGLAPELFSSRALRRCRGLELELAGLHPSLVDIFLGRNSAERKSLLRFDADTAKRLLRGHIQEHARTSARNLFRGRISQVRPAGLLAEVSFGTASGLEVRARITSRSCRALGLAPGIIVSGAVKALGVAVYPAAAPPGQAGQENRLVGTLEAIRREGGYAEALIILEDGSEACAVRPAGEMEALKAAGEKVVAVFSADAVILNLG